MVRIIRFPGIGRRLAAAAPVLALAVGGGAIASGLTGQRLHVPDDALTSGASPTYPSVGPPPAPMQLPPVYDTFTGDWARRGAAAPLRPSTTPRAVRLDAHGIPAAALAAYHRAANLLQTSDPGCGLDWALLGAIGRVESNHARFGGNALDDRGIARPGIIGIALDGSGGTARILDTDGGVWDRDSVYDRAVGPMQFIPGTWRAVGADGDGDGVRNPQDLSDAATAAGVYLCSGHSDLRRPADAYSAVLRYNHSDAYAQTVLSIAAAYRKGVQVLPVDALPAARSGPASGSGADDSGFAWADDPPPDGQRPPESSTTTQPSHTTTAAPSASSPSSPTANATPRTAGRISAPAAPRATVPGLSLPAPSVTSLLSTSTPLSTIDALLALPHLAALPGDPDGLVRVLDPSTGQVVCLLNRTVVACP